jgi:hypothetical protein
MKRQIILIAIVMVITYQLIRIDAYRELLEKWGIWLHFFIIVFLSFLVFWATSGLFKGKRG